MPGLVLVMFGVTGVFSEDNNNEVRNEKGMGGGGENI